MLRVRCGRFLPALLLVPVPVFGQCTAVPLISGQIRNDVLNSSCLSSRRPGSWAKLFTISANAGDGLIVDVSSSSSAYNPYVYLAGPDGAVAAELSSGRNPVVRHTAAATGLHTVEVTTANTGSNGSWGFSITATVAAFTTPTISSGGVVNGAGGLGGIASGSWVAIYGTSLSATTRTWTGADFRGDRLPLSLDGVSVKISDRDAPVYFVSPGQVNVLAPADTSVGAVLVTVTNSRGTSAAIQATLQTYAPALFTFDPQGSKYPAAVHLNGSLVGPDNLLGPGVPTSPAVPGERILLFGTGFGPTSPAVDPAVLFSGAAKLSGPDALNVTIGGVAATVEFAGLAGNGLYQLNVVVPGVPDGDQPLVARIGSLSTQSNIRLAVQSAAKPQIRYPGATRQDALDCPGLTCLGKVTASPGEQVDFWVAGTNLSGVTGIQFQPPEGIDAVVLETSETAVRFSLRLAAGAALGKRPFTVRSEAGESNQSSGPLNISTFRVSNLRIGTPINTNQSLSFAVTLDYTDPTGAVSSGTLSASQVLVYEGGTTFVLPSNLDPEGRTPGATGGVMRYIQNFSNITGTTGAIYQTHLTAKDGRESDTVRVLF